MLLLALTAGPDARAQTPVLVKDLNPQPIETFSSDPREFVRIGDWIYFTATTRDRGKELYRTNGLPGSTQLVKDINPGRPSSGIRELTDVGGTLFFVASDGNGGLLFKSDGTGPGTIPIPVAWTKEFNNPRQLAAVGATLFFSEGLDLWKSDGTAAGTVPLRAGIYPLQLTVAGNRLFFSDSAILWRSDGTQAGTVPVLDTFPSGPAYVQHITAWGDRVYFSATDGVHGVELWISDGTPDGTVMVADLLPGPSSSSPSNLLVAGDLLFFFANYSDRTFNPAGSAELFRSDGTAAGTKSLGRFAPNPVLQTALHGTALFSTYYPNQGSVLRITDGTLDNTGILAECVFPFLDFRTIGARVWFSAFEFATGQELWITDGTPAGTGRVTDIAPGPGNSIPAGMTTDSSGTRLVYSADDGTGREPWVTSLTSGITERLLDVNPTVPGATESSDPKALVDAYGVTLFSTLTATSRHFWATDGSGPGTVLLRAENGFQVIELEVVGDQAFLNGVTHASYPELYVASAAGTRLVNQPFPGLGGANPRQLGGLRGLALFTLAGFLSDNSRELYRSDGVTVELVKDINPGPDAFSDPAEITAIGPRAFFSADDGITGRELWWTDGTGPGTSRVMDIQPGVAGSTPHALTRVGDVLYFVADDGIHGPELWRSDAPGGTETVADIAPGLPGSEPAELTPVDDVLYFVADDGVTGRELWQTDGSQAGTRRVADAVFGVGDAAPHELTAVGDRVFFTADDGQNGRELWTADGAGAEMVADIYPGPEGSGARLLTAVGSRQVWFAADDGIHGSEMWRSDGTLAGTVLVHDLYPNDISADISEIVLSRGNVLFGADDGVVGGELWRAFPGATAQEVGEGCGVLGRTPHLRANDPVLGATSTIVGSGAVPQLPLFLVLGLPQRPMSVAPAGAGCYIYLDPLRPFVLQPIVPAASRWATSLDVPAVPSLTGVTVVVQSAQGPTGAPLGFDVSNGVILTLGY